MFVAESRPRTRRWCNTGVCGSLVNVRRHRSPTRKIGAKRMAQSGVDRLYTFRGRYATDLQNLDAVAYLGRVEAVGTA